MKRSLSFIVSGVAFAGAAAALFSAAIGCGPCGPHNPKIEELRVEGSSCLSAEVGADACDSVEVQLVNRCLADAIFENAAEGVVAGSLRRVEGASGDAALVRDASPTSSVADASRASDGSVGAADSAVAMDSEQSTGGVHLVIPPSYTVGLRSLPKWVDGTGYVLRGTIAGAPVSVSWRGGTVYNTVDASK